MGEPMLWSDAENAIGRNRNDDFILSPEAHSEILPPQAGPLKRVLTTPEVKGIIESYGNEDREAVDAQRLYRRARRIVDWLAILAAATGLVACSWHLFMSYVPDPQPTLVIVHAFLLLGLVGSASWLNWTDPRTKWLKARSKAEQHRVALFNRVLAANETHQDGELSLLPLQLAYFRRYQLDVQLSYFKNSGRRLERTVGLPAWITVPSVIVAAGALLVATAYLLNLADERGLVISNVVLKEVRMERAEQLAYWIFVALSLSTVYAIAMTRPAVSEEQRTCARYLALFQNLDFLKTEGYERVRRAAEAGDNDTVAAFFGLVHGQMLAEQSHWLSFQGHFESRDHLLAWPSAIGLASVIGDHPAASSAGERKP